MPTVKIEPEWPLSRSLLVPCSSIHTFGTARPRQAKPKAARIDVAVALRIGRIDGLETIVVLPITSRVPLSSQRATEIPEIEKRRAGLHSSLRLWIVFDEANLDVLGKSFFLSNQYPLGHFSPSFFVPIARKFVAHFKSAAKIDRTR